MSVTVNRKILFRLLDELLARRAGNLFPYTKKDAVIPQTIIPDDLRKDKRVLACFYFYACIYMRGGIESVQAFNALIRMWRKHPYMFDPLEAQWLEQRKVKALLKRYIGWDSEAASITWLENSRRLVQYWRGDPLMLIKGLRSYDEALRRIRNKTSKIDQRQAGTDGAGFRGFQPKMVSMLLYFYDWEGWLEKRFYYPPPADFHNFRLGFNQGAIVLSVWVETVRVSEKISILWRNATMDYLRARKADPVVVADAIWLFSLVMCGNSPLNRTTKTNGSGMFAAKDLPHTMTLEA